MISQEEKSKKVLLAEKKLAQAKVQLNKAKREQRAEIEMAKSHHKYMIGASVKTGAFFIPKRRSYGK